MEDCKQSTVNEGVPGGDSIIGPEGPILASRNLLMLQILSVERFCRMSHHCSQKLRSSSKDRNVIPNLEHLKPCCGAREGSARERAFAERILEGPATGDGTRCRSARDPDHPMARPLVARAATCPARLPVEGSGCLHCALRRPEAGAAPLRLLLFGPRRGGTRALLALSNRRTFPPPVGPDLGQLGSGSVTTP